MGPWSADLPDVSPPEKQLACQRARLYLNTHSSTPRSCMRPRKTQALMVSELGWDRRGGGERKRKRGERFFGCHVHSRVDVCGLQGWLAGCLAAWLLGLLACWALSKRFSTMDRYLRGCMSPTISISETCPPPNTDYLQHLEYICMGLFLGG